MIIAGSESDPKKTGSEVGLCQNTDPDTTKQPDPSKTTGSGSATLLTTVYEVQIRQAYCVTSIGGSVSTISLFF